MITYSWSQLGGDEALAKQSEIETNQTKEMGKRSSTLLQKYNCDSKFRTKKYEVHKYYNTMFIDESQFK